MITRTFRGDIFETKAKHIAFALNTEGSIDCGFAWSLSKKYWPELEFCGKNELGTVLSKKIGDKTFHALICHSCENGWNEDQTEIIKECFDKIPTDGEPIATVVIGTGAASLSNIALKSMGANLPNVADYKQIICGMHDSEQEVFYYGNISLEEIMSIYAEQNLNSLSRKKRLVNKFKSFYQKIVEKN